jgi:hypothetical protein
VLREPLVQVHKELLELRAPTELKVSLVHKAPPVQEHRAQLVHKELTVHKVLQVQLAHRVFRAFKV